MQGERLNQEEPECQGQNQMSKHGQAVIQLSRQTVGDQTQMKLKEQLGCPQSLPYTPGVR